MAEKSSWSLAEIASRFWDDAGKFARNILSFDRIVETQDIATERLKDFQIAINKTAGTKHKTGDPKDLDRARDKAKTDYDGDMQRVTDYARGKMIVDSPGQVRAIERILDDRNSDLMKEHGICVVSKKDFFANPKGETGYRCMNYKIAIPVGENENGEVERQVVELQVVASQIERINDLTHPFKRRAEDLYARAETEERDLFPEESNEIRLCFATCRYYNGLVGKNNGYDEILDPLKRSKLELNPQRQHKYLELVRDLQELDRRRDDLGDYLARQAAPVDPETLKAGLDPDTGHWIRYGIYRPVGSDPEFFKITMVRNPNDDDAISKPDSELEESDFVFNRISRWDFEEADWRAEPRNINKMSSSDFSDSYAEQDFHERMLRHESTLVRRYFESSGLLEAQREEEGMTYD